MSEKSENIVRIRRLAEGVYEEILADGSTIPMVLPPLPDDFDDRPIAEDDPDNPPMTDEELEGLRPHTEVMAEVFGPDIPSLRNRLGLTQDGFAQRYGLPLPSLRDWEQKRSMPPQAVRSYLKVIAQDPETVASLFARHNR